MTLSTCFVELEQAAARLLEVFQNLSWAVTQGQPSSRRGPAIVDHWEAAAQDTSDLAQTAYDAAREGRVAANGRLDMGRTRRALTGCQAAFDALWLRYSVDIAEFERRMALQDALHSSPGWAGWAKGTIDALGQAPQALYDLSRSLTACWEEMVDQQTSISVTGTMHDIHIDPRRPSVEKRLALGETDSNGSTAVDPGI